MRLLAGIILAVIVENIVLGIPGLTNTVSTSSITVSDLVLFAVGCIVSIIVLQYGTQLSRAAADTFDALKNYEGILTWIFQLSALYTFYSTSQNLVADSGIFGGTLWAYPLIFIGIGLIPTVKVVLDTIHIAEGSSSRRHN